MKYCRNCGTPLEEQGSFCPNCGQQQKSGDCIDNTNSSFSSQEESTVGWSILGFFIPLVGLILYLVWYKSEPKKANAAGKGALIGAVVSFTLGILSTLFSFGALGCILNDYNNLY